MQKGCDPVTFYARSTWGRRMALSTDSCEIDTQLSSRGVRDVSALFLLLWCSSYPADSPCVIDPKPCVERRRFMSIQNSLFPCNIAGLELSVHAKSGTPTPSCIQALIEVRMCSCSNRFPENTSRAWFPTPCSQNLQ